MKNCSSWILVPIIVTVFAVAGFWTTICYYFENPVNWFKVPNSEVAVSAVRTRSIFFHNVVHRQKLKFDKQQCKVPQTTMRYVLAHRNKKICSLDLLERKQKCNLRPPFLSIAGDTPPESCIFSQVLNMTAFLVTGVAVLRYSQLKAKVMKPWLNIFGLITISLSSFGMTIVANFQLSNNRIIHNVGAVITIGFGTAACWIQAVLTFQGNINNVGRKLGILRVILSVVITLGFITYFLLLARHSYLHGARLQWTLITCLLLYEVTFAVDFWHYGFEVHSIEKQTNSTENVSSVIPEYY